jgi:hypothetical protein
LSSFGTPRPPVMLSFDCRLERSSMWNNEYDTGKNLRATT